MVTTPVSLAMIVTLHSKERPEPDRHLIDSQESKNPAGISDG
jgi:hypothetical protein